MAEKYDKLFLLMKDNDDFTKNILMLLESKQLAQNGTKTEKKIGKGIKDVLPEYTLPVVLSTDKLEEYKEERKRFDNDMNILKEELQNVSAEFRK